MPLSRHSRDTETELTPVTDKPDYDLPFAELNTTEVFANATAVSTDIPNFETTIVTETTESFTTDSSLDENELNDFLAILNAHPYPTRNGRNLKNSEHFPHLVKIILNNQNVGKWTINQFADQMVTHQCHFGLSENLLESLAKVGEVFQAYYQQYQPAKLTLVDRYFDYIANQKNLSGIIPVTCLRNTSNVETLTTTIVSTTTTTHSTTPIPHAESTFATDYNATEVISTTLRSSSSSTTTELIPEVTLSTTVNAINSTLNSVSTHNHTIDNVYETSSTRVLNSQLVDLGLVSAGQGVLAGFVHGVTGSIFKQFAPKNCLSGWRKPLIQAGMMLANVTLIATLPAMLTAVKESDESEQSDLSDVLQATAYSFANSLALSGINYAAQSTYAWFNGKPMNESSMGHKALEALPLLANTSFLINHGYDLTQASVIVGANTTAAILSSIATQSIANRIFGSTKKATKDDIELGNIPNNNNRPLA